MRFIMEGEPKEIAALVLAVQERQKSNQANDVSEREQLIREYERRLRQLKDCVSPGNIVF